jgi:GntR family transcriptional regulator / MocR family aminotransferase
VSSGLHVVAWFEGLPRARESELAAAAFQQRVLVYPISSLYLPGFDTATRSAGFVLGYASLDPGEIDRGVKRLAAAVEGLA